MKIKDLDEVGMDIAPMSTMRHGHSSDVHYASRYDHVE